MAGNSLVCGALTYGGIKTLLCAVHAREFGPGLSVCRASTAQLSHTAGSLTLQEVRPVQPNTWSHSAGHCLLVG